MTEEDETATADNSQIAQKIDALGQTMSQILAELGQISTILSRSLE